MISSDLVFRLTVQMCLFGIWAEVIKVDTVARLFNIVSLLNALLLTCSTIIMFIEKFSQVIK